MRTYLLFLPWLASTTIGHISGFLATVTIALWHASDFSHVPSKRDAETQTVKEAESGSRKGSCEIEKDAKTETEGAVLEGYVWYNHYYVTESCANG